jgi:hypothetical protein
MAKTRFSVKPNTRFLIPSRRRVKQERLSPDKNAKHFHHLAELNRLRNRVMAWFEAEKKRLGFGFEKDAQLMVRASRSGKEQVLEKLLQERDRKVLNLTLDVAGIKSKKKRSAVLARAREFIRAGHLAEIEVRQFFPFLNLVEKEALLSKPEALAFRKAFGDWVNARQLFGKNVPSFQ